MLIPLKVQADGMTAESTETKNKKLIPEWKKEEIENRKRYGFIKHTERARTTSSFYCDIENIMEYDEILYSGDDELCNQFIKGNEKKYKFGNWKKSKKKVNPPDYWTNLDLFNDGRTLTLVSHCIIPYGGVPGPIKNIYIINSPIKI